MLSRERDRERTVFLRRASVEYEILVAGLTHQLLEEREDLQRHREDQDFVAVLMPEVEQLSKDLRDNGERWAILLESR